MNSYIEQLTGKSPVQTPLQAENKVSQKSNQIDEEIQQALTDLSNEALSENVKDIAFRIAETYKPLTDILPDSFRGGRTPDEYTEALDTHRAYASSAIGADMYQNPALGGAQNMAVEMAPYLAAAPAYASSIGNMNKLVTGSGPVSSTARVAMGQAPITGAIDTVQGKSLDEQLTNQAFGLGMSPLFAGAIRPRTQQSTTRAQPENAPQPNRSQLGKGGEPTDPMLPRPEGGPIEPQGGGGGKTFDVEPIAGTEKPMSTVDRVKDIFNPEKAQPVNRSRKEMMIDPKENVSGELKDMIDRNNLDTVTLKSDLKEVFANTKQAKPNKWVQRDVEEAMIKGIMPKSVQAQKVLGKLLAMPRYRDNTLSFIPHPIAKKLNLGVPLTKSDNDYLSENGQFLNEKQRAQVEVLEDIERLKSSKTPFDTRVELMNKYGDTETVAVTPEMAQQLKSDPEALKFQLQITLDNIKNITGFKQALDETASARGSVLSDEKYIPEEEYDALGERISVKTMPESTKGLPKKTREDREVRMQTTAGVEKKQKARAARAAQREEQGLPVEQRDLTPDKGTTVAEEFDSKLVEPTRQDLKAPVAKAKKERAKVEAKEAELREKSRQEHQKDKTGSETQEKAEPQLTSKQKRNRSMNTLYSAVQRAKTQEDLDLLVKKSAPLKDHERYEKFKARVIAKRKQLPKAEPKKTTTKKTPTESEDRGGYHDEGTEKNRYKVAKEGDAGLKTEKQEVERAKVQKPKKKTNPVETKADDVPQPSETQRLEELLNKVLDSRAEPKTQTGGGEDLINANREWLKEKSNDPYVPIHGERGAEALQYEHSIDNPAVIDDATSTKLFTKPKAKDRDKVARGYFEEGSVFVDTQMRSNGKGFGVYVHESMHGILSQEPYLSSFEDAFRADYGSGNIPEIASEFSVGYIEKDDFVRYEEAIVMVAADKFTESLPVDVKERLGYTDSVSYSENKYNRLTPKMKEQVDMLIDLAQTALKHKDNELNQYAYGTDESTFRELDRIGYDVLSEAIDAALPHMINAERKLSGLMSEKNYSKYKKGKEWLDELYANVMSQTSQLPAQKFIDKYTAIARTAEENGREVSNVVSGRVQELFPDRAIREKLTPVLMRKDLASIQKDYNRANTYAEFTAIKDKYKESIRPYMGSGTQKMVDQTVKGLNSLQAMNSPYWQPNARAIMIRNPRFKQDSEATNLNRYITDLDKYLSMQAVTARDFAMLKAEDQGNLNELIDIANVGNRTTKFNMDNSAASYIKGYKPSLFKENIEFSELPDDLNAVGSGWKRVGGKDGVYYRKALPVEHIEGMMPSKNQLAKGRVDFDDINEKSDIVQFAEEFGYGLAYASGKMRLRKVMTDKTRNQILKDNNDIAENMAAMFEQTVHNKTTKDSHVDMAIGLNKNNLITGNKGLDNTFTKMTPEELRMLPRELRQDLFTMHGKDNLYIAKKYKEQMIGANVELSAIKHLTKSGINITHEMLLMEAKVLDVMGEMTSVIKQKIILNNPVVITGNLAYGNVIAKMEGASWKDLKQFQQEGLKDFKEYTDLKQKQIEMYIAGKTNTPEYQKITTRLNNNLAYKLFAEGDNTISGIDRNLLLKATRESNLGKKHMEQMFTDLLGGPDKFGYKMASELFMTPHSKIGSAMIKALNYVDYLNRSTLTRLYMKQGLPFEEAARKANSKTVSFSKRLPSSLSMLENKGFEYFLGWAMRNGVGVGKSVLEHPASWAAFAAIYFMLSEEDPAKHDARYIGNVRVSSFNPLESVTDGWADGGIYASMANDGVYAFEPALTSKVLAGKNPVITTRD